MIGRDAAGASYVRRSADDVQAPFGTSEGREESRPNAWRDVGPGDRHELVVCDLDGGRFGVRLEPDLAAKVRLPGRHIFKVRYLRPEYALHAATKFGAKLGWPVRDETAVRRGK